jgi:hypothetical protein
MYGLLSAWPIAAIFAPLEDAQLPVSEAEMAAVVGEPKAREVTRGQYRVLEPERALHIEGPMPLPAMLPMLPRQKMLDNEPWKAKSQALVSTKTISMGPEDLWRWGGMQAEWEGLDGYYAGARS